jgi:hypothetical protein
VRAVPLKKMALDQLLEVVRENHVAMMMAEDGRARKLAERRRRAALRQYHVVANRKPRST